MEASTLLKGFAGLLLLFIFYPSSHQQTTSNKCIEDFSNTLLGCVREGGLNEGNFLWYVTNGTSKRSQEPANADAFKTQVCAAQQQVGGCVFQRMATVINSTACVGTSQATNQQEIISTQLTSIFSTYDAKCMHPCRKTLATDLRNCYTDSGLDPNLFLSNSSNGAVVGSTEEQVTLFCGAKDALISCMRQRADACPEAPQILRAIDLDIPSFDKGVTVLCAHPKVYLHGLKCFEQPTNDVDKCQQREAQALIQLDAQARQGNWSQDRFFQSFCEIALEQLDCDLKAWTAKNHEACVPSVIGLRRELECELVPPQCNVNPKQISAVNHACNPEKFMTTERDNFQPGASAGGGGGGGDNAAPSLKAAAVPLATLLVSLLAMSL